MDLALVGDDVVLLVPAKSDDGDSEVDEGEGHHQGASQVGHQVAQVVQQLGEREAGCPDHVADDEAEDLDDGEDGEDELGPGAGEAAREHGRQEAPQGQDHQQAFLVGKVALGRKGILML